MIATAAEWPDDDWNDRFDRVLKRLAPEHRIVLVLQYREQKDQTGIAAILQIPVEIVPNRLRQAHAKLREALQGDDGDQR